MRAAVAIGMIVLGVCLLIGPLLAHAYNSNRDKDRVAEFYSRNSNAAVLPLELHPSGYTTYDWGCFAVGTIMAGIGVMRSRSVSSGHSA